MIQYGPAAARAIGFLKAPVNDIEVFVEDTSKTDVWLALVKACLPPGYKVKSVTPLHGRERVINACKLDQAASRRRRIYLVDGDFDFVQGRRKPNLKHLHRIPSYCLEGLVIRPAAIRAVIEDLAPAEDSTLKATQFTDHLEKTWGRMLRRLFLGYAINNRVDAECKTSSYHVSRLSVNGSQPWTPNPDLVQARFKAVSSAIKAAGGAPAGAVSSYGKRAMTYPIDRVVSGKTYILPLLTNWFSASVSINLTPDQTLLMLIGRSNKCPDWRLQRALSGM